MSMRITDQKSSRMQIPDLEQLTRDHFCGKLFPDRYLLPNYCRLLVSLELVVHCLCITAVSLSFIIVFATRSEQLMT